MSSQRTIRAVDRSRGFSGGFSRPAVALEALLGAQASGARWATESSIPNTRDAAGDTETQPWEG